MDRLKHTKVKMNNGDNMGPNVDTESIIPIIPYKDSCLAGPSQPSPYQLVVSNRPTKLRRVNEQDAFIAAGIVNVENKIVDEATKVSTQIFFKIHMNDRNKENEEELKFKMENVMREKSDLSNCDQPEAEKVRKENYLL
ncbi:hypothetical protein SUGI_1189960 [Cryptomeria japonica]|nr:hypothetical protein SUGI_1189960 [Cryptomeria japonica]